MTRITELTLKLLDSTLSESESTELVELLASDPSAAEEHLLLLELEAALRGLRTDFDFSSSTLAQIRAEQATRTADAVLAQIANDTAPSWAAHPITQPARTATPRRKAWLSAAAVVACAAAVLLLVLLNMPQVEQPDPGVKQSKPDAVFARLTKKTGSVELFSPSGEVMHAEEGGELSAGFTLRTHGDDSHATIEFLKDRTRVEIEADSIVRFSGAGAGTDGQARVFLALGQLTAAVPSGSEDSPMIVGTAVADVFAHESTFVVSSAGPESARVDIKKGKVELVRKSESRPVPLGVGGSVVVFAGHDRLDIEHPQVNQSPLRTLHVPGAKDAIFSDDGKEVWIASARSFTRWSATGATRETSFQQRRIDGFAAFSPDHRYLLTFRGERDDRILVHTLPDCGEHAAINARPADPRSCAIAPDASWIALTEPRPNNKRLRVIDSDSGDDRFTRDFDEQIACMTASPDGKLLGVALFASSRTVSNSVVLLDARTGERVFALSVLKRAPTWVTFSPDGQFLAVGFNGTIQLWDIRLREVVRSFNGFERVPMCLTFSQDGRYLAAGTQDGRVWVWVANSGQQLKIIEVPLRGFRSLAFSPTGSQLVTLGTNGAAAVWDLQDPERGREKHE